MKRKNVLSVLLVFLMAFSLCACGSTESTEDSSSTVTTESAEEAATEETTSETGYETIEIDETVSTDFCEITFTTSLLTNEATHETTGLNLENEDDSVWAVFIGEIKNTASSSVNFASGCKMQLVIDDKYSYTVTFVSDDINSISPLSTAEFAAYASIPNEALLSCETYSLQIGFIEEFAALAEISDATYLYQINGSLDQYGSVEQIQNATTFFEYVQTYLTDNAYDDLKMTTSGNFAYLKDGNCLDFVYGDGVEIYMIPYLSLQYYDTYVVDGDYQTFGGLYIEVNGYRKQDGVYYTSTTSLVLKSDAGEIAFENSNFDYTDTLATNKYFVDLSRDVSVEEFLSVLTGENPTVELTVKLSGQDDQTLFFECDEKFLETVTDMMNICLDMPCMQNPD